MVKSLFTRNWQRKGFFSETFYNGVASIAIKLIRCSLHADAAKRAYCVALLALDLGRGVHVCVTIALSKSL